MLFNLSESGEIFYAKGIKGLGYGGEGITYSSYRVRIRRKYEFAAAGGNHLYYLDIGIG